MFGQAKPGSSAALYHPTLTSDGCNQIVLQSMNQDKSLEGLRLEDCHFMKKEADKHASPVGASNCGGFGFASETKNCTVGAGVRGLFSTQRSAGGTQNAFGSHMIGSYRSSLRGHSTAVPGSATSGCSSTLQSPNFSNDSSSSNTFGFATSAAPFAGTFATPGKVDYRKTPPEFHQKLTKQLPEEVRF